MMDSQPVSRSGVSQEDALWGVVLKSFNKFAALVIRSETITRLLQVYFKTSHKFQRIMCSSERMPSRVCFYI